MAEYNYSHISRKQKFKDLNINERPISDISDDILNEFYHKYYE